MEVVRNIQIMLDVPEDNHEVLDETFEQFRQAAQHVANAGWSDDPAEIEDTKNTLHEQTYADVREQTSLQASLVQSARNLAADALGNCKDRILDDGKKSSKPEFRGSVVVYNGRTITYNDDHVTLATVGDRVTAEFVTPKTRKGRRLRSIGRMTGNARKPRSTNETAHTTSTLLWRKNSTPLILATSRPRTGWFSASI
jgi:hypothetical protein